jgi:hypothetical protein
LAEDSDNNSNDSKGQEDKERRIHSHLAEHLEVEQEAQVE